MSKIVEFRQHETLSKQWETELKENQLLRLVLEAMDEEHPAHNALNGDRNDDVSPTRAAIELGLTRGYSLYADRLKLMAIPLRTAEPMPESEYSDPEKEEEEQKE